VLAALAGDTESAIQALQQYPLPLNLHSLQTDPTWDAVRPDRRFQDLIARETQRVAHERQRLADLRQTGAIPPPGSRI
jgi:hypothetical protein